MFLASLVCLSFKRIDDEAVVRGLWKRNLKKDRKKKGKYECPDKVEPYCRPQSDYAYVSAHGIFSA